MFVFLRKKGRQESPESRNINMASGSAGDSGTHGILLSGYTTNGLTHGEARTGHYPTSRFEMSLVIAAVPVTYRLAVAKRSQSNQFINCH
jgi:hypothetical protein